MDHPVKLLPILMLLLLTACSGSMPTATSIPPTPTIDPTYFTSNGGGEPRSAGYWLLWNACASENKAGVAAANGGREAGWVIMDDLLIDPGILIGKSQIETCEQGLNILNIKNLGGTDMKNDAAYVLSTQLFAAQLNLAAGSEYCPASDLVVSQAQLLLLELDFDGTGTYLGPPLSNPDVDKAQVLVKQLASYNYGELCR